MKASHKYQKWVEWGEEDQAYLGKCPNLIPGRNGDDHAEVFADHCEVVDDVIRRLEGDGRRLPRPSCGLGGTPSGLELLRPSPDPHHRS